MTNRRIVADWLAPAVPRERRSNQKGVGGDATSAPSCSDHDTTHQPRVNCLAATSPAHRLSFWTLGAGDVTFHFSFLNFRTFDALQRLIPAYQSIALEKLYEFGFGFVVVGRSVRLQIDDK